MVRNNEIVICQADKDGKIIVITHEDYQAAINAQLEKFDKVPTQPDNLQHHFDKIRSDRERSLINLFENDCISKKLLFRIAGPKPTISDYQRITGDLAF